MWFGLNSIIQCFQQTFQTNLVVKLDAKCEFAALNFESNSSFGLIGSRSRGKNVEGVGGCAVVQTASQALTAPSPVSSAWQLPDTPSSPPPTLRHPPTPPPPSHPSTYHIPTQPPSTYPPNSQLPGALLFFLLTNQYTLVNSQWSSS